MSAAPYMQLYVADYLGDTQHLTTEQHGAYLLLLMAMWRAGGSLPNDPAKLARIARVTSRRWAKIAEDVLPLLTVDGDTITQKRLQSERKRVAEIAEKKSLAGKASAEAKRLKDRERAPTPVQQVNQQYQSPEPEPDNTTLLRAGAREAMDRLCEVAGPRLADPAKEPGLTLSAGLVLGWLRDGADLELDIVPVVRERTRAHGPPITSWKFFEKAVAQAKANRSAPLPPAAPQARHDRQPARRSITAIALRALNEIEDQDLAGGAGAAHRSAG